MTVAPTRLPRPARQALGFAAAPELTAVVPGTAAHSRRGHLPEPLHLRHGEDVLELSLHLGGQGGDLPVLLRGEVQFPLERRGQQPKPAGVARPLGAELAPVSRPFRRRGTPVGLSQGETGWHSTGQRQNYNCLFHIQFFLSLRSN
jgi:hypothetical protein